MIKELIDKENQLNKDKESFLSKVKEYEDEIKSFESKMLEEKNTSDLMKINNYELETEINCLREILKENNINYDKDKLSNTNVTLSRNEGNETISNFKDQFEDFLKGQKNLTEEDYEILSYDVESGKQRFNFLIFRSSFKLSSSKNEPIQLTKFIPQIENNDISVLYHRKVIEKIIQYKSKVRSIDLKAMSTIYLDEVKQEYEHKLNNLEKQLRTEFGDQKVDMEKEIVSTF
jgi:hypothetical protein